MEYDDFIKTCFQRIEFNISNMTEFSSTIVKDVLTELYSKNFTVNDAVSYVKCMEEVNPSLNEDVALKRMSDIRSRYQ